jgi:hypothetical protein
MNGLDMVQLRREVVRPTLQYLDLWSPAAENLVLGTAAHESGGCRYLAQIGGPALGLYQIEPATHDDLWANFLSFRAGPRAKANALASVWPEKVRQLATNLAYASAICRLIYFRAPDPLPAPEDIVGLAALWKRVFNTGRGKGTEAQFIEHYREYVR